jgi:hypothetical protein
MNVCHTGIVSLGDGQQRGEFLGGEDLYLVPLFRGRRVDAELEPCLLDGTPNEELGHVAEFPGGMPPRPHHGLYSRLGLLPPLRRELRGGDTS